MTILSVKIPDIVGKIFQANPNAGRDTLHEKTGLGLSELKYYRRLWNNRTDDEPDKLVIAQPEPKAEPKPKIEIPEEEVGDKIKFDYKGDTAIVDVQTDKVLTTLEDLIEIAQIDLDKWKIDRWVANSWNVTMKIKNANGTDTPDTKTNYQIKAWLKAKMPEPFEIALERLLDKLPSINPEKLPDPKYLKSDYAVEICPFDMHYGKLACHLETHQGNMDVKICDEVFIDAIARNLNHAKHYPISKIYYILGNDLMHVENIWAQTPMGQHRLDTDDRLSKVIEHCEAATVKAILMCREVAPVEVIWIPGNHDPHASYWMSRVIATYFKDDPHIIVDNSPAPQKARAWGDLLVGWAHNSSGRVAAPLVNLLAQYFPKEWGESRYREWHTGHKHKKNETKFMPVDTIGGVLIRQIPAMSTVDYWHTENVFTDAVPACESFLWHKQTGVEGHFTANVEYPTD